MTKLDPPRVFRRLFRPRTENSFQYFVFEYEMILFCRDFSSFSIVEILEAFLFEEKPNFQSSYF